MFVHEEKGGHHNECTYQPPTHPPRWTVPYSINPMRSEKSCGWKVLLGTLLMCRRMASEISLISEWLGALLGDKLTITIASALGASTRWDFSHFFSIVWNLDSHLNATCMGIDLSNFPKACRTRTTEWTSWTRHTSTHLHKERRQKQCGSDTKFDLARAGGEKVAMLMNVPVERECMMTFEEALWTRRLTEPVDCYTLAGIWWGLHSKLKRRNHHINVHSSDYSTI